MAEPSKLLRRGVPFLCLTGGLLYLATTARAADVASDAPVHGLDPFVLISIALMLFAAKVGGEIFSRLGQPAVLGELISGMILGGLALVGLTSVESLRTNEVVAALAEIGVIILLFEVGLESNLSEMRAVGWSSLLVAMLGVVAPFFLGWGVAAYFTPDESTLAHIFIGATLTATSVGITARVLKDMGQLQTREARIILGAAVIDDILGLLVLAVVAGAIRATATGGTLASADVALIAAKSVAFLVAALLVGRYVVPHVFRGAGRMESRGVLVAFAVAFCFLLAWAAAGVGLAPIVGAFAAGLVLDEVHFEDFVKRGEGRLHELLAPVSALLVPIFFVLMGLKVDLRVFARVEVLGFAVVLTLAAIIGKQVCSFGVVERGINRLAVGLGMIPRGEVGLIFAGIGATLMLPDAQGQNHPVIGAQTFAAVVIMVIITTLITPPVLKWSLARKGHSTETTTTETPPHAGDATRGDGDAATRT
ncbi:MAG TPA: cation:proton antiporter [Pyrinomonadaceae bacterium]|jgi:Kef-type K+ transport system membrane component KefB|nr:cation:proton antiporter [Pyrinomonadaceae bacterium]